MTAVDFRLLADQVRAQLPDPSPLADPSETEFVAYARSRSADAAEQYVARRLTAALKHLRTAPPTKLAAAQNDARRALAALGELLRLEVPA